MFLIKNQHVKTFRIKIGYRNRLVYTFTLQRNPSAPRNQNYKPTSSLTTGNQTQRYTINSPEEQEIGHKHRCAARFHVIGEREFSRSSSLGPTIIASPPRRYIYVWCAQTFPGLLSARLRLSGERLIISPWRLVYLGYIRAFFPARGFTIREDNLPMDFCLQVFGHIWMGARWSLWFL